MPIDYQKLKNWPFTDIEHCYTARDTILYALALGYGADPLDPRALRYVYERDLVAAPTMAFVLGYPGFWMREPGTGIDWVRVLHGEQRITLHAPLPAEGTVLGRSRVTRIIDKGEGKGALVVVERTVIDTADGRLLATLEQRNFCRGDGGFSTGGQPSDEAVPAPPRVPEAPADAVCDIATRPESALLYRLCGDPNPLHADPEVARAAGFERPVLHGMATFGVAGHAVLRECCDYDAARLTGIEARFSAPVYPGETIRTELWRRGSTVHFRCSVPARDVVVLNNGVAEVAT